jgi:predicted acylesterase/phospholipase RssA
MVIVPIFLVSREFVSEVVPGVRVLMSIRTEGVSVERKQYTVLTIDGGGIRGIIPAGVLQDIEERTGRRVCELFDMVSGTSTGGIIALGLAKPRNGTREPANRAADLLQLYMEQGPELFPHSETRDISTLHGMKRPRYPHEPLETLCKQRFEDTMLSDALIEVVVPSYDLSMPGPFFFKRCYTRQDHDWDVEMWRVARATSAAPTYFEPACLAEFKDEGEHALVDGGVYANNPTVAAYSDATQVWPEAEIHVVSIGTGHPPQGTTAEGRIPVAYAHARHWGLFDWALPMLDVVLDGVAKAVEWQMERLCETHGALHYHRLQSPLPTASHAMDDASEGNLGRLLADAETLVREQSASLDAICSMLASVAAEREATATATADV